MPRRQVDWHYLTESVKTHQLAYQRASAIADRPYQEAAAARRALGVAVIERLSDPDANANDVIEMMRHYGFETDGVNISMGEVEAFAAQLGYALRDHLRELMTPQ